MGPSTRSDAHTEKSLLAEATEQVNRRAAVETPSTTLATPVDHNETLRKREARKEQRKEAKQRRQHTENSNAYGQPQRVRKAFAVASVESPVVCACLDVEAWEKDETKITEIGLA